jgi:hypothetical protein
LNEELFNPHDERALKVKNPAFLGGSVGQTSYEAEALSTVTVSLAANVDLCWPAKITLRGFTTSMTQRVDLTGNDASSFEWSGTSSSAYIDGGQDELQLQVASGQCINKGVSFTVSLNVTNPSYGQPQSSVVAFVSNLEIGSGICAGSVSFNSFTLGTFFTLLPGESLDDEDCATCSVFEPQNDVRFDLVYDTTAPALNTAIRYVARALDIDDDAIESTPSSSSPRILSFQIENSTLSTPQVTSLLRSSFVGTAVRVSPTYTAPEICAGDLSAACNQSNIQTFVLLLPANLRSCYENTWRLAGSSNRKLQLTIVSLFRDYLASSSHDVNGVSLDFGVASSEGDLPVELSFAGESLAESDVWIVANDVFVELSEEYLTSTTSTAATCRTLLSSMVTEKIL